MNCDAIVFIRTTIMVYIPRLVVVNYLYFELLLLSYNKVIAVNARLCCHVYVVTFGM